MELDIELIVGPAAEGCVDWVTALPEGYVSQILDEDDVRKLRRVGVRYADERSSPVDTNVGENILQFLSALEVFEEQIRTIGGELRLGIYYDLDETVVFPVRLSSACIRTMGRFNLSLDSTGYPCNDE